MRPDEIKDYYAKGSAEILADPHAQKMHDRLLDLLERGQIRTAERSTGGEWIVHSWVKEAILVGFRRTPLVAMGGEPPTFDKGAYPPRRLALSDGIRIVPGGSAIRRGAYVAPGVVLMPPAYVNVGAYVGEHTMVDSHALVGSCAQIGTRVHLSAGAQIGGVLEPAGARPVVIEDEVFVGALAGVFEGVLVRRRAVLAAGVILTGSTTIFDLVHECERKGEVPEGAVIVPGTRPAKSKWAADLSLATSAPMIVKYRDAKTDAATALEGALR